MNFQGALTLLKEGKKLRRASWLFFGFLSAKKPAVIEIHGTGQSGVWRPTQDDLFADDWEVYRPEPEAVQLAGLTGSLSFHDGMFQWKDPTGATSVNVRDLGEALRYARRP